MALTFTGHTVRHDGVTRKAGAHCCVPDDAAHLLAGPIVWKETAQKSEVTRLITSSSKLQVEGREAKESHSWSFLQVHPLGQLIHGLVSRIMF